MVVVRLFQGTLISVWQTHAGLISIVLLLLFIVGVVAWGLIDGREDAASNPDPDRRGDLAMTWLLAGLVAGLLSGAVTWLISVFYQALYVGGLINELTTFAAFTALVVFLGAISGVAIVRWRVDRTGAWLVSRRAAIRRRRRGSSRHRRVRRRSGRSRPPLRSAAWPQEQSTSVATAERDYEAYSQEAEETTEAVSPAAGEEATKKSPWPPPSAAKTEALPSHEHSESATEHIEKPKSDDH